MAAKSGKAIARPVTPSSLLRDRNERNQCMLRHDCLTVTLYHKISQIKPMFLCNPNMVIKHLIFVERVSVTNDTPGITDSHIKKTT